MSTIKNRRDKFLQNISNAPRMNVVASDYIQISSTASLFKKTAGGLSPSTITVTAIPMGRLTGLSVSFTTVSGTGTVSVSGNVAAVSAVTTSNLVLKASISYLGNTYESNITVSTIDDTVTSNLSTSSVSVPAEVDGSSPVLTSATSTVSILVGSIDDTVNWGKSWVVLSGTAILSGSTTSVVSLSTMSTDVVVVRLTATKATYPTQIKDFTITKARKGAIGTPGTPGTPGVDATKQASVVCYKWSTSVISTAPAQAFTYTWSTGAPSVYPSTWAATPPTNTTAGAVLYRLEVRISDAGVATTTASNWDLGSLGSFGYTSAGTIGILGDSARMAYLISTSATTPVISPTSIAGDTRPSGWSASPTTPTAGQFLYQVDGTYSTQTNTTTWAAQAYLSNLKVGSLSAITTNTGALSVLDTITLGTAGKLITSGKTYASATAGIFLGYDSTTYKLDVGNSTNYMRWNGTSLEIKGSITGGSVDGSAVSITNLNASNITSGTMSVSKLAAGTLSVGTGYSIKMGESTLPLFYVHNESANKITNIWSHYNPTPTNTGGFEAVYATGSSTGELITAYNSNTAASSAGMFARGIHGARFRNITETASALVATSAVTGNKCFYAEIGNFGPFTGAHDALLLKETRPYIGDIIYDYKLIRRKDYSDTITEIRYTSKANERGVVGVLSSVAPLTDDFIPAALNMFFYVEDEKTTVDGTPMPRKGLTIPVSEYYELAALYNLATINSVGEGQLNVCGENGNLVPGDLIVSSSMPGKGMRQSDDVVRGYTVAKCREHVYFSNPLEVKPVACIYLCG